MKFSVIIPNLNSLVIDQTIAALEQQNIRKDEFEIIVVGRDDPGLVHPSEQIKVDLTERPYGPAEARNRGAKQARGDILVFLDADCVPSPGWLAAIEHALKDSDVDGVGGGVRLGKGNYWVVADNFAIFHDFLPDHAPREVRQYPSLNLAIRREAFWQVRGFDESYPYPAGEDFDLTYRMSLAGYRLRFEPEAWVEHHPPRNTFQGLWRHGYVQGMYSTKVDPRYADQVGLPKWLRGKGRLRLFSPFLAAGVTLKIFLRTPQSIRYSYTLPAVFLSKFAWGLGAADSPLIAGKI
jgi:glycosyltransferase involved in cell wall biosynthesis